MIASRARKHIKNDHDVHENIGGKRQASNAADRPWVIPSLFAA